MSEAAEGTFRTHAQYLRAFAHLAGFTTPTEKPADRLKLVRGATELAPSINLGRRRESDLAQVRLSLANAWGTELLLALSGEYAVEDELVRVSNSWGVVQAYYALYHATQALVVALGQPRPTSHPKTQQAFSNFWTQRRMVLPPWTMGAGAAGYINFPDGIAVDESFHPWKRCDKETRWQIAAKALRTTRDEAVDDALRSARDAKTKARRKQWQAARETGRERGLISEPGRANLTQTERSDVSNRVRTHTILDYLYRLRVKANYEDVAVFTEGPTDSDSSRRVHKDLVSVVAAGLTVHELHVRRLVGAKTFGDVVSAWATANMPQRLDIGIGLRQWRLYAE